MRRKQSWSVQGVGECRGCFQMLSTADDMTGGISSHRAEKKQTRQRKREKRERGNEARQIAHQATSPSCVFGFVTKHYN